MKNFNTALNLLSDKLKTNLLELPEYHYGSMARAHLLIKYSLNLRELIDINDDLWAKFIARHKEELAC